MTWLDKRILGMFSFRWDILSDLANVMLDGLNLETIMLAQWQLEDPRLYVRISGRSQASTCTTNVISLGLEARL